MTTDELIRNLRDAIVSADNPEIVHGFRRSALHVEFLKKVADRLEELDLQNVKMREALKPFFRAAQMAETNAYSRGDDPPPDHYMAARHIGLTLGDLRRAAAVQDSNK